MFQSSIFNPDLYRPQKFPNAEYKRNALYSPFMKAKIFIFSDSDSENEVFFIFSE